MSFLSKFFGGGGGNAKAASQPPPIAQNSTVETFERVSSNIEKMEKRQRILEKEINDLEEQARKHFATKTEIGKKRAIGCMKRKKAKDKELDNSIAHADRLREIQGKMAEQEMIIEQARIHEQARNHMAGQQLDVNKIYDVTQDIAEQQKEITEASEVLATPFNDDMDDDDDILAELEGREAEDLQARLDGTDVSTLTPLPAVDTKKKQAEEEEDESLLAELGLNLA